MADAGTVTVVPRSRVGRLTDPATCALVAGCATAVAFTLWLTWGIWAPGIPWGDDVAAHVARTDLAFDEIFTEAKLDGWQPTFGFGYQAFLFVGPGFTILAWLIKLLSFGTLSNLAAFKAAVVVSMCLTPVAVAFVAWAFGLGKRAAGIAAVLSLVLSTPFGGAGLLSIFGVGLIPNQLGSVFFCLALGGMALLVRRPAIRWAVLTGASVAGLITTHLVTTLIFGLMCVAAGMAMTVEWLWTLWRRRRSSTATTAIPGDSKDPDSADAFDAMTVGSRSEGRLSRPRAFGAAVAVALGLSSFVWIPLMAHFDLRGVGTAFNDIGLAERLPAIWKGEFLLRPWVAAFIVAGLVFELGRALRGRPMACAMVLTPVFFLLLARGAVALRPGNILTQVITNRGWAYVGFLALLPLADLLSRWGGVAMNASSDGRSVRPRSLVLAVTVPVIVAGAIVVLPPEFDRDKARTVQPTPAMVELAEVLRRTVPEGGRFTTQRLPPREVELTGMTHPDFWLAATSGRNTLNIWNPESSSVGGAAFEADNMYRKPADLEADLLTRYGVTHVVLLDHKEAVEYATSPRYRRVWELGSSWLLEVLPQEGRSSLVTAADESIPIKARMLGYGPEHLSIEVDADRATTVVVPVAWSPKWRAAVDGAVVDTSSTVDNFISVPVPAGRSRLALTFGQDAFDWIGRAFTLTCVAAIGAVWLRARSQRCNAEKGLTIRGSPEEISDLIRRPMPTDVDQPPIARAGSAARRT